MDDWMAPGRAGLRMVPEGLMTEALAQYRVGVVDGITDYYQVAELKGRVRPPGLGKRDVRQVAGVAASSGHSKAPIGTIYLPAGTDVRHKDRFVHTGTARVYDVVADQSPNSEEIKRRLAVREVQLPEREMWLALAPEGYDGAGIDEVEPELVRVLPVPFITDALVEMVDVHDQVSRLKQLDVAEISRAAFTDANISRLLYCLVVMTGTVPTGADAAKTGADKVYTRYRFNGAPALENHGWSSQYPYRVGLIEKGR